MRHHHVVPRDRFVLKDGGVQPSPGRPPSQEGKSSLGTSALPTQKCVGTVFQEALYRRAPSQGTKESGPVGLGRRGGGRGTRMMGTTLGMSSPAGTSRGVGATSGWPVPLTESDFGTALHFNTAHSNTCRVGRRRRQSSVLYGVNPIS